MFAICEALRSNPELLATEQDATRVFNSLGIISQGLAMTRYFYYLPCINTFLA
jgi:hypothetical protein